MLTIWKYQLKQQNAQQIEVPEGARLLCVQIQHGFPCLWALVDPAKTQEKRAILIYGTGHPIEHAGDYIGTFQASSLVFHVFSD